MLKLSVESYICPSATAFISAEGARLCFLYGHLEGLKASGDKNCYFSLCLLVHVLFLIFLVGLW